MNEMRQALLRLICAAPGPCNLYPGNPQMEHEYSESWDTARAMLRQTCPNHIVDGGGTCPNCHGDTDGDPLTHSVGSGE